ncbi:MAG TPA: hypothetical protein VKD26_07690 [Streptosporangiaceae bacterium]|nr:hypothetical protein [Streptosporangiaceae bacterium]
MKKTIVPLLLALAGAGALLATTAAANAGMSTPRRGLLALTCPAGTVCGSYTVSGLGARKQEVLAAGGTVLDLSVAMEETATMRTSYYPYVANPYMDNPYRVNPYEDNPYGDNKTGDSTNFGIFKQNWMIIRTGCNKYKGQTAAQYNNGAALNSDLQQDVTCMNQDQSHYGQSQWIAGHRAGASGLKNPNTTDINRYKTAIYWIQGQLYAKPQDQRNDTRYWVYVPSLAVVANSIVGDTAQNGTTVIKAVPVGSVTLYPDGHASVRVRITFSDGTQVAGVANRYANGENTYTVSRS